MELSMEPNPENKLFVGGCPPGSTEEELRKVFEPHGQVEEVFIMRIGSRSGMACAFVRFQTRDAAQAAIDAIHGQLTLPKTSEPLVVRWADAPGAKRRVGRDRRPRCNSIEGLRDEAFAYYANMLQYPHVPEVPTSPQGYSANFFGPVPSASWQHHQIAMAYYQPFQPQSYFFGPMSMSGGEGVWTQHQMMTPESAYVMSL